MTIGYLCLLSLTTQVLGPPIILTFGQVVAIAWTFGVFSYIVAFCLLAFAMGDWNNNIGLPQHVSLPQIYTIKWLCSPLDYAKHVLWRQEWGQSMGVSMYLDSQFIIEPVHYMGIQLVLKMDICGPHARISSQHYRWWRHPSTTFQNCCKDCTYKEWHQGITLQCLKTRCNLI